MASVSSNSKSELLSPSKTSDAKREKELISDSIATGMVFALTLTLVQRVVGFGRGILFCRLMTDQQLGQWSMIWSYLMLLAPLAVLGLPGCFGKFTEHYRQKGQLGYFIARITAISIALTLLMALAIFLFPKQFSYFLFRDVTHATLVQFLGIALIFVTASNFLTSLMESLRQVRVVTIMRFLTGIVFAAAGTMLIWFWKDGAAAATTGFAIACLIGSAPAIWILWHYRSNLKNFGETLNHRSMWVRIAPFAIWMWLSDTLNNLFEISDRYMLIHWSASTADIAQAAVGQYHSGRVVPLLLVSIGAMLAGVLLPYLSKSWEDDDHGTAQDQMRWAIKLIAVGFTAGGVVILILSPLLFDWILQGRYNEGLSVLPMTLVYCIWTSLLYIGQVYLWVAEKGKWIVAASAAGLLVNVGLNMLLIPRLGLEGAVLATAIGNFLVVGLTIGVNHFIGCRADVGIWISLLFPIILLTGTVGATLLLLVGIAVFALTNLHLNGEEKELLVTVGRARLKSLLGN